MELIYYWINEDNCIHEQGFCFSPEYDILMMKSEDERYELKLERKKMFNVFASDVVSNLTVLVGDNGAGKSTLLKNILNLNCYEMTEEDDEDYQQYTEQKNAENKNLIILREEGKLSLWTNIYKKDILIPDEFIENENVFYISDSDENIAGENIINNSAYCGFTKIYISNSYFDEVNGMGSHGTLSDLVITPAMLSCVASTFFTFVHPDKLDGEDASAFDLYSKWLRKNKYPREFQQICDLIFYNFLVNTGFIEEYEGIVQTQIRLKIRSVWAIFNEAEKISGKRRLDEIEGVKSVLNIVSEKYERDKAVNDPIYVLKANLLFEWYLEKGIDESKEKETIEEMYAEVEQKIVKEDNMYFREAVKEVSEFSVILSKISNVKNVVPKKDRAYKIGKETLKYAKKEISKASEWAEIIAYIDQRARLNKEIYNGNQKYGSFLLRYLNVENLTFSSGERVFQNLMSWMYYLSQLDAYTVEIEHHARENIILCLDEIDLSLHPAWQRDFVEYLVRLVNECYKGKHIQIIMTTHSPLCLSNIPRDNIIYLKKTENGTQVDNSEHKETFGTNLYELLDDSFYLGHDSMGRFAKNYIRNLIKDIGQLLYAKKEDIDVLMQRVDYIGDPLIRNKLKDKLLKKLQESESKEHVIEMLDKEIRLLTERRNKIMEEKNK